MNKLSEEFLNTLFFLADLAISEVNLSDTYLKHRLENFNDRYGVDLDLEAVQATLAAIKETN